MKDSDARASLVAKIGPSLIEVLSKMKSTTRLTDADREVLDAFYGQDGFGAISLITSYFQALADELNQQDSLINPDSNDNTILLENMPKILSYIMANQNREIFQEYNLKNRSLLRFFRTSATHFLKDNNFRYLSSEKADHIQQLLLLLYAKFPESVEEIELFEKLNTQLKDIAPNVKYNYFLNYLKYYIVYLEKKAIVRKNLITRHEKYWLNAVFNKFQDKDIDDIWEDDIVTVFIQMLDQGLYEKSDLVRDNQDIIDDTRKQFLGMIFFKPANIKKLHEVMDNIINEYKDKEITDYRVIKDFYEAFKTIYVYELISGKQNDEKSSSADYSRFVIAQMQAFKKLKDESDINYKVLIDRAVQTLVIKDSSIQYKNLNLEDTRGAITYIDKDFEYSKTYGLADFYKESNIVSIATAPFSEGTEVDSLGLLDTIGQTALEPIYNMKEMNFEAYMEYKTMLLGRHYPELYRENDDNLYHEVRAKLYGVKAQLDAIKKFPIISPKESLKTDIIYLFNESLLNKLVIDGEERSTVELMDDYVIQRKPNDAALLIEYNSNGEPKTFNDILSDLENVEPQFMEEQTILRLKIIMSRAIAYDKPEEFKEAIESFFSKHPELDSLKKLFPNGKMPTKEDAEKIFEEELYENEDINMAELAFGVYKMADRLLMKSQGAIFTKGMLKSLYESLTQYTENNPNSSKVLPQAPHTANDSNSFQNPQQTFDGDNHHLPE